MNRFVKIQLTIFAIVTVIGLVVMSTVYLKLPTALGWQRTDASLEIPDTGGLYKNANVSYLGNVIGGVDAVTLKPGKVVADFHVESGKGVPENVRAQIRSASAVGEQYIDLVPDGAPRGRFGDGTVLGPDKVDMPQGIGPVLDQGQALLSSVDDAKMKRVLAEAFDAFNGSERDLQQFLDSSKLLLDEAHRNSDVTRKLIADAEPLLDSQLQSSEPIRAWTRNVANVADQLRANEPELTSIMQRGPGALDNANKVLTELQPTMPVLVANLMSVGEVGVVYNKSLEQILVLYPALVSALITVINGGKEDNSIKADFTLNINETPPCTTGFLPAADRRNPTDMSVPAQVNGLYCKVSQDSQITARGARNFPCMEYPGRRAASPEECAAGNYTPLGTNPPDTSEVGPPGNNPNAYVNQPSKYSGTGTPTMSAAVYDPKTGEYVGADGQTHRQQDLGTVGKLPKGANMTDVLTNGVSG